jgi:glycosyltransferase involved in cell wall biosynthesis
MTDPSYAPAPTVMNVVAVVLTLNEEKHLARCLRSLQGVVDGIVVADCFSTDGTLAVARGFGARVIQRQWQNYATQFNWAIGEVDTAADWILRIDADEYLTPTLARQLREQVTAAAADIDGIYCSRRMTFQGRLIRHGGVFPVRVLRLFRRDRGRCELRWMDEHIKVEGRTVGVDGEIIDDNLNSLTWWTDKHNKYASREAVDLLNLEYGFMPLDTVADLRSGRQDGVKRWLKEVVYARLPSGGRACLYFAYRYIVRLGFLDGAAGTAFHFLQGFWYRYLVDAKIAEVKRCMRSEGVDVVAAIDRVLDIRLTR